MIRSMTGFGKGSAVLKGGKITVEIKTVNHKYFDATIKLRPGLSVFEDRIKEFLQKKIERGKVYLGLVYDGNIFKEDRIAVDYRASRRYHGELKKLARHLGLGGEVTLKDVISLPGVLIYEPTDRGLSLFWPKIKQALGEAVEKLITSREREGKALCADLLRRAKKIESMLAVIRSRSHLNVEEYRKRFADRVKDMTGGRDMDVGRLEMEAAIYAKNCDISEEVTRLKNHLVNLKKTISASGEAGKKLDFIAQELHREINTAGSKASDFRIAKNVIEIKGEIEKIREQAKNLE